MWTQQEYSLWSKMLIEHCSMLGQEGFPKLSRRNRITKTPEVDQDLMSLNQAQLSLLTTMIDCSHLQTMIVVWLGTLIVVLFCQNQNLFKLIQMNRASTPYLHSIPNSFLHSLSAGGVAACLMHVNHSKPLPSDCCFLKAGTEISCSSSSSQLIFNNERHVNWEEK